jgi:hypothetical protein
MHRSKTRPYSITSSHRRMRPSDDFRHDPDRHVF